MAIPPIRLPKYSGRTLSGMIITAKKDTNEVKNRLYTKITNPVFSRFFSLGCSISRFTCARVSSPLIASTEWPNPTNRMTNVKRLIQVPYSHPSDSLVSETTPGCSGLGGI